MFDIYGTAEHLPAEPDHIGAASEGILKESKGKALTRCLFVRNSSKSLPKIIMPAYLRQHS
jgi:hypothetical protein